MNHCFIISIFKCCFPGLFGVQNGAEKDMLVSPLSDVTPKWHSTNYIQYLIREFDCELVDIRTSGFQLYCL